MASVTTEYKQAFLENIADKAIASGKPILDALKDARNGQLRQTSAGLVLIATSGNGHSATYQIPAGNASDITPVRVVELCQELVNRCRMAARVLGISVDSVDQQAAILTEMLASLVPVTEMTTDFSGLRA